MTSELNANKSVEVSHCAGAGVRLSASAPVAPVTEMSQLISGHVATVAAPLSPARCRLEVTI